jgi:hypothetical protein
MVKGKKTKERKKPPIELCTLQCNNLATNRLGFCAWLNQPLFYPCLCTTLNYYYVAEAFKVMGLMFLASLNQLTQIHQHLLQNDKPHSFPTELDCNIQKKNFPKPNLLILHYIILQYPNKSSLKPNLFTLDYIYNIKNKLSKTTFVYFQQHQMFSKVFYILCLHVLPF